MQNAVQMFNSHRLLHNFRLEKCVAVKLSWVLGAPRPSSGQQERESQQTIYLHLPQRLHINNVSLAEVWHMLNMGF
jgi:hypothetical protein